MFYYIDWPRTPSFPVGLVKTESDFIARSVEIGLGTSRLVVAVIIVDTYPFLDFSDLICHLKDKCFLVTLNCLIVKRPNLEVVTKRLLHQQVKILG